MSSNFGHLMRRKKTTMCSWNNFLTKGILWLPIQRVLKQNTNSHIHKCGLIVNPNFDFLGSSSNGKVCEAGECGLLEVKCPYASRYFTINEACNSNTQFMLMKDETEVSGYSLRKTNICIMPRFKVNYWFREKDSVISQCIHRKTDRLSVSIMM